MRKILTIMGIVVLGCICMLPAQDGCSDGGAAAHRDTKKSTWFMGGFCCGVLGWGAAWVIEPVPSETELLGKSPEYVAAFKDCYRSEAKETRKSASLVGCVIGTLISLVVQLILVGSGA